MASRRCKDLHSLEYLPVFFCPASFSTSLQVLQELRLSLYVRTGFTAELHGKGDRLGEARGGESTNNIHPSQGLSVSTGGSQPMRTSALPAVEDIAIPFLPPAAAEGEAMPVAQPPAPIPAVAQGCHPPRPGEGRAVRTVQPPSL